MKKFFQGLIFIVAAFLPSLSALFVETGQWYANLNKPVGMPPDWLFGPVWSLLYCLIGIASYLAWLTAKEKKQTFPVQLYIVHLGVNGFWTYLFFGLHDPGIALIDIVVLLILIILLIRTFYRIDKRAALLFLPYLLWVVYATFLNAAIIILN
jgi:translocator protein